MVKITVYINADKIFDTIVENNSGNQHVRFDEMIKDLLV